MSSSRNPAINHPGDIKSLSRQIGVDSRFSESIYIGIGGNDDSEALDRTSCRPQSAERSWAPPGDVASERNGHRWTGVRAFRERVIVEVLIVAANKVILMTFPEKLTEVFKELEKEHQLKELSIEINPTSGGRFVAIVTSESFEEIPDYLRQELVWGKVLEKLDDYDQRLVEFIYTPSPSEEREEAADEPPPRKPKRRR